MGRGGSDISPCNIHNDSANENKDERVGDCERAQRQRSG